MLFIVSYSHYRIAQDRKHWHWQLTQSAKVLSANICFTLISFVQALLQIKWALIKITYLESLFTPLAKLMYHQNNFLNYLANNLSTKVSSMPNENKYVTGFAKRGLIHASDFATLMRNNFICSLTIRLKFTVTIV